MAKNATSNAFINAKKKKAEISFMKSQGMPIEEKIENIFEEQHHHLLSCLEHATVIKFINIIAIKKTNGFILIKILFLKDREFAEMDSNVNLISNQLIQLKIQSSGNSDDNKLINNLINCFCCKHLRATKSFNNVNSNNNINKNVREYFFILNFIFLSHIGLLLWPVRNKRECKKLLSSVK